jgi:hypothetical protein
VEVKVPFGSVSWLATPLFMGGTTELKATVTMRKEPGTNNM